MRNINRLQEEKFSFGIKDIIKDATISFVICLILYLFSYQVVIFILFIPFSIAAVIGDVIRKYTKPKAISTKGGAWKILNNKLYWDIGPQIEAITLFIFFFHVLVQILGESSLSENQKNTISDVNETISYRD